MSGGNDPLQKTAGRLKTAVVLLIVFSFGINILMLAGPLYMMQVYDRVLGSRSVETLVVLTVMVLGSYLALSMLDSVRLFLGQRISDWIDRSLSQDIVQASISAARTGTAPTAQGLRDLSGVKGLLGSPAIMPLFDAPFSPIFLIVLWILHPILAVVALTGMVIMVILGIVNDAISRKASQDSSGMNSAALTFADLAVRDSDSIAAMGMQSAVARKVDQRLEEGRVTGLTASNRNNVISSGAKGFRFALQSMILGVGAWLVLQNQLTPGAIIAATTIMARAIAPTEQAIGTWRSIVTAKACWGRLKTLFETADTMEKEQTSLPAPKGTLTVDKVVFQPKGTPEPILKGVGFELKPGDALGLIGPSGSGKSTLLKLIGRSQVPTRGAIRVDGADLSQWSEEDRGRWIGYLAQDVMLLPGTVKENIARFDQAEDEQVFAAAQRAGVDELIRSLPLGYDTVVGPGGHPISGGQRQRIGLARALFGDPRLVLLDEPASNLDAVGDTAVMQAMERMQAEGRTVILVAHRPSLLRSVQKVLVLKNGKVEDFGDRDMVMAKISGLKPVVGPKAKPTLNTMMDDTLDKMANDPSDPA